MDEIRVGTVTHFFQKPMVAAVKIEQGTLSVGDAVHIKGHTTDLHHRIDSIQIEHRSVETAKSGDLVGIRVSERVREHDEVYKIEETGQ